VPAASFVTEAGSLCRQCFAGYQNDQEERARVAAEEDRLISRRAKVVARVHAVIWGVTAILTAEALRISDGVGTGMFLATLGLGIGLAMRKRWAFLAALALDGPGTVCLAILAVMAFKPGRGWIGLFMPPFTLASGYLLWRARAFYPSKPADSIGRL
jgi:hypothetical protein